MVYLIHFDTPFKHARHYIGFAETDLEQRIKLHRSGGGAKILRAVNNAGINWSVVRVWDEADRNFERKLKNHKKSSSHCPICKALKNGTTNLPGTPGQDIDRDRKEGGEETIASQIDHIPG